MRTRRVGETDNERVELVRSQKTTANHSSAVFEPSRYDHCYGLIDRYVYLISPERGSVLHRASLTTPPAAVKVQPLRSCSLRSLWRPLHRSSIALPKVEESSDERSIKLHFTDAHNGQPVKVPKEAPNEQCSTRPRVRSWMLSVTGCVSVGRFGPSRHYESCSFASSSS